MFEDKILGHGRHDVTIKGGQDAGQVCDVFPLMLMDDKRITVIVLVRQGVRFLGNPPLDPPPSGFQIDINKSIFGQ